MALCVMPLVVKPAGAGGAFGSVLGPGLVVSDAEVLEAVAFALLRLKLVVEPGGAAALAAALSGRIDLRDKTALLVVSGGNADAAMLARALAEAREARIGSS